MSKREVMFTFKPKNQVTDNYNRFSGPYVVKQLPSPHMVVLRDLTTNNTRQLSYTLYIGVDLKLCISGNLRKLCLNPLDHERS